MVSPTLIQKYFCNVVFLYYFKHDVSVLVKMYDFIILLCKYNIFNVLFAIQYFILIFKIDVIYINKNIKNLHKFCVTQHLIIIK